MLAKCKKKIKEKLAEYSKPSTARFIETKLKNWKEEDKTFVESKAVISIVKCVQENKCVTITGNSGMGKTVTLRHIVLQMADKGYDIIPVNEPHDVEQYYSPDRKTVFMIDDFCGTFSANKAEIEKWKTFIDQSYSHLNTNVKLIVACRTQVFNENLFKTLTLFNTCVCDLLSKKFKLSNDELQDIAKMYLESEAEKVAKYVNLYPCFPLLCRLYKDNPSLEITQFFQNPFSVYEKEIDNMLADGHNRKYCALFLCVVFNNSLEDVLLTDDIDKETRTIFKNVFETCRLNRNTSRIVILDELNILLTSFLCNEDGCYRTVHDKVFDFLSYYFGQNKNTCKCLIQNAKSRFIAERFSLYDAHSKKEFRLSIDTSLHDMFMERLIKDWLSGDVVNVFTNTNMKLQVFRHQLLIKVKSYNQQLQRRMADTCDKESKSTVLIMCCFYDDVHWLYWCFQHQIEVNKCETNFGVSPLHVACLWGHTKAAVALLDKGADINKCTTHEELTHLILPWQEGSTEMTNILRDWGLDINKYSKETGASPLYLACLNGHTDTVNVLLNRGADINQCTHNIRSSALIIACHNGHTETVNVLLDRGADINKCTARFETPLFVACHNGKAETVSVLLDRGVDINKCSTASGASPLFIACQNGHIDTVNVLLDKGADINKCSTDFGASPLFIACQNGHIDTVNILLDKGADINIRTTDNGTTPLHAACCNGHTETVVALLNRGADINEVDAISGVSSLYLACHEGHAGTVNVLLDKGANLAQCEANNGASPLFIASQQGHTETVNILLDRGADLNKCTTTDGCSPLFAACKNGHIHTMRVLIGRGAAINQCTTDNGASPLHAACFKGHLGMVNDLLDKGADINQCTTDIEASPLYIACQQGHFGSVNVLLDRGADINKCETYNGATPLYIACQNGHLEAVNLLLNKGADINKSRTTDGATPLHVSYCYGHMNIVELLLSKGANPNTFTF